jgi:hypothetical protein
MPSDSQTEEALAATPLWTARLLVRVLEYNGISVDCDAATGTITLVVPDDIASAFASHVADILPLTKLGDEH